MRRLWTVLSFSGIALGAASFSFAAEPLPDSVLASVGTHAITRSEFERQWQRLAPTPDSAAKAVERRRSLLDLMVDKELVSLAADEMAFEPDLEQAARLALTRENAARQAYYQKMALDSLPATGAPAAHGHGHGGSAQAPDPQEAANAAGRRLVLRLLAPVHPRWDDSTAAILVRAFAKLPASKEEGPGWVRWNYTAWMPPVAEADTARALGHSDLGPFTVGRFLSQWAELPPGQRDRPDSTSDVIQWAEGFLAQGLMDVEARRLGLDRAPEVEAEVTRQRRLMAVDAFYRAQVSPAVDTSESRLASEWKKNPHGFDGPPRSSYLGLWYRRWDDADACRRALERGAAWDSVLLARFPAPASPEEAHVVQSEADLYRKPQELLPTTPDSALAAWFAHARPGQVFGPRNRAGQWWVYRFLQTQDGKRRSYAEARPAIAQQVAYDDEERGLRRVLDQLRVRFGVRLNEDALRALAASEPR